MEKVKAEGRPPGDRPLGPEELSKRLGYSRASLKVMRATKSKLIEGLSMFKICDCESTRRKTQARCNHPFYAWESDVNAFFQAREARYRQAVGE